MPRHVIYLLFFESQPSRLTLVENVGFGAEKKQRHVRRGDEFRACSACGPKEFQKTPGVSWSRPESMSPLITGRYLIYTGPWPGRGDGPVPPRTMPLLSMCVALVGGALSWFWQGGIDARCPRPQWDSIVVPLPVGLEVTRNGVLQIAFRGKVCSQWRIGISSRRTFLDFPNVTAEKHGQFTFRYRDDDIPQIRDMCFRLNMVFLRVVALPCCHAVVGSLDLPNFSPPEIEATIDVANGMPESRESGLSIARSYSLLSTIMETKAAKATAYELIRRTAARRT